ncbi:MAG: lamin tail domain-containing protein [Verrucomicrobia subdivision 3 bacterium]|nr:lamin tail domain-containing protein [Limisphaerales bacterium]
MQFRDLGLVLLVFTLTLAGATPAAAQQSVIITEFLADNSGGLQDEDGDSPDWIELFNTSVSSVNLAGWHLTDDTNDLTKWTFPTTNLGPSSFMVVFASGKDRRVPGANLHTSFNLEAQGEYLALVRPDGVTIATEIHFPEQRANYSYGLAQSVQVTRLIMNTQPVRVLVPTDGALGNTWRTNDFSDASWLAGTNGVGYETAVPGFAVRNFKANVQVSSLAAADTVIATPSQQTVVYSENAPVINYVNTGGGANFSGDRTFPGLTIGADVEDFVIEAVATVTIPAAGPWTFGVNSDDGFRLNVGTFSMAWGDPRGPADTFGTFNFPAPGEYPLRLVFYERGGGSELELFAAQGTFTTFNATAFRLVGNVAGGGLQVRSTPVSGGGSLGYRSNIRTDIQTQMRSNNASAFIRIPFAVGNPASFTSLTLQMRYDDGFVAWLNGQEVARRLAPATPTWNSAATGSHLGVDYEDINVTEHLSLLRTGNNLLAIHGLNQSAADVDFFIMAELAEYRPVGLTAQYLSTPTPGSFNSGGFSGFVSDTKFNHDRGFYETNFSLVITTATAGASIRYTTNGSTPSATSGLPYTGPIFINGTRMIRAVAYKTGLLSSDVDTHTYIFLNDVILQSPTGQRPTPEWPNAGRIGANQIIDYGMDPDIVNNAVWGPQLKDALKSIPTFSVVTDLRHLFDPATGIYANPSGDEITWERPTSLELIYPDGREGFQINAGIRIRGGFSRSGDNPKHAFRFFFRREYGEPKLHFPVFGPEGAEEFDKFDLRTMQNYSWAFQNDARMICVRDSFSRDAQIAMGHHSTRGDFFHLYVNGQYWGLYNTEERSEAAYGESYFGGRAEDYDVVKVDPDLGYNIEATDGNLDAWLRLWQAAANGFANDTNYFRVQGLNVDGTPNPAYENLLDVPNLIDYMLVIIYGGNLDAPISNFLSNNSPNNWFGMRNRVGRLGFRFFAHDSEHTLLIENINVDRTGPFPAGDPAQGSTFSKSSPQYVWSRLYANAEFRMLCADHIQRHFFNGGVFTTRGARNSFLVRSNEIQLAIVAESARWGDSKSSVPYTRNQWVTEMNRIYNQYFSQRPATVLNQLRNDGLFPSVSAPIFSAFGGLVPAGFTLYMTNNNTAGTIYYTLDGSDPRRRGGAISPTAIAYTPGTPITINFTTRVRARVLNGTVWSAITDATFYTLQDFSKLLVSEIMYHPPDQNLIDGDEFEFIELKNTGSVTQDLSGLSFSEGISFTFTNGTRLLPGEFFVLVRNATNFAAKYPGAAINGVFGGELDNGGERLTIAHTLGGTVVSFEYNDVAPWPATPDGLGFSLVPVNPNANPNHGFAGNWRASSNAGGSPGADDPASAIPAVLITEALTRTDASASDAIELYNAGGAAANIGGWFLTDDVARPKKYRIADGTMIEAGAFMVFTEAQFNANPLDTNSFSLSSFGDEVYLFSGDAMGNLTGFSHGFQFGAADDGVTFGRYVNSHGEEHFVAQVTPTLGSPNSGPAVGPIVIRQFMYHPPDLPNNADNVADEFIEIQNIAGDSVPLYDPAVVTNTWRFRDAVDFDFPQGAMIAPSGSALVVSFNPTSAAHRMAFLSKYGLFTNTPMFGPFTGKLDNSRDSIELYKPGTPTAAGVPFILVDRVEYQDVAPWPSGADGSGASLKRIVLNAYGNDPTNWSSFATLSIQAPPRSFIIRPGTNLTFMVTAIGTGPLRYQWRFNGANIPGATAASYSITNVQPTHEGEYTAVVSDDSGSILSAPGVLTVLLNPVVTKQPLSQTVFVGDPVTFSVDVAGTLPFGFRWRKNGVTVVPFGQGTAVYTVPSASTNDIGIYTVVVTNYANSAPGVVSQGANLFVHIDADGDRMADFWEQAYGITDPGADADGDGVTNAEEFNTGTDPTDPTSKFRVELSGTMPGGGALLRFIAMSNRSYSVQFRDGLDTAAWTQFTNVNGIATNRNVTVTNPAPGAANRFYRVATPEL